MSNSIGWWAIRLGTTVAGCLAIQRVLETEGRSSPLSDLLVVAAVTLVVVRLWTPGKD
jgi:hypothetical protein